MTQFGFIASVYHYQERDDVAFCSFANKQFHAYLKNNLNHESLGLIWIQSNTHRISNIIIMIATMSVINRHTNISTQPLTASRIGNILSKTGLGSYTYGSSKPHAVTGVENTGWDTPPELCGVQEFLIFIYSIHICCILNYSSGNWEFIQPLLLIILII